MVRVLFPMTVLPAAARSSPASPSPPVPRVPRRAGDDGREKRQSLGLFRVQLLEQAFLAEVERAPRPTIPGSTVVAVVPAPTRRATGQSSLQVGDVILCTRLP